MRLPYFLLTHVHEECFDAGWLGVGGGHYS